MDAETDQMLGTLRDRDDKLCTDAANEINRLLLENWQLKGALGYPVPGDVPEGNFKCGMCEARNSQS